MGRVRGRDAVALRLAVGRLQRRARATSVANDGGRAPSLAVERLRRRTSGSGDEQWWSSPFSSARASPFEQQKLTSNPEVDRADLARPFGAGGSVTRRRTPPHSTPPLSMAVLRWSHRRTLTLAHHETQHHLRQNYPRRWLPRTIWGQLHGDSLADSCKRNLSLQLHRRIYSLEL